MLILQEVIDSHLKEKKTNPRDIHKGGICQTCLWNIAEFGCEFIRFSQGTERTSHGTGGVCLQLSTQQPFLLQLSVAQVLTPGMDASIPKPGSKALCCLMPEALEASPTQQPGFSAWGSSLSLAGLVIWKLNNLFDEFLIFSNKIFTNNCFHYLSRSI